MPGADANRLRDLISGRVGLDHAALDALSLPGIEYVHERLVDEDCLLSGDVRLVVAGESGQGAVLGLVGTSPRDADA